MAIIPFGRLWGFASCVAQLARFLLGMVIDDPAGFTRRGQRERGDHSPAVLARHGRRRLGPGGPAVGDGDQGLRIQGGMKGAWACTDRIGASEGSSWPRRRALAAGCGLPPTRAEFLEKMAADNRSVARTMVAFRATLAPLSEGKIPDPGQVRKAYQEVVKAMDDARADAAGMLLPPASNSAQGLLDAYKTYLDAEKDVVDGPVSPDRHRRSRSRPTRSVGRRPPDFHQRPAEGNRRTRKRQISPP